MKRLNIERARDRYDKIMYEHICEEAALIENPNFNLRDMVAEADYYLGTFYDCGHMHDTRDEWKYDDTGELRKEWYAATGKLKRFIAAYEPFIHDMVCTENHGSDRFDNCPNRFK
jgi:hypothetical protein